MEDAAVSEELVLARGLGRRMRRARASGGESGGGWMRTAEKPGTQKQQLSSTDCWIWLQRQRVSTPVGKACRLAW